MIFSPLQRPLRPARRWARWAAAAGCAGTPRPATTAAPARPTTASSPATAPRASPASSASTTSPNPGAHHCKIQKISAYHLSSAKDSELWFEVSVVKNGELNFRLKTKAEIIPIPIHQLLFSVAASRLRASRAATPPPRPP